MVLNDLQPLHPRTVSYLSSTDVVCDQSNWPNKLEGMKPMHCAYVMHLAGLLQSFSAPEYFASGWVIANFPI